MQSLRGINSSRVAARGWYQPSGGYHGVSENVVTRGPVARRLDVGIPGLAAVCGDGPLLRDAAGKRAFGLRIEGFDPTKESGIYVGFVAATPESIDWSDAQGLWETAVMWRLVDEHLSSNVPLGKPTKRLKCSQLIGELEPGAPAWSTDQLELGDDLRLTAEAFDAAGAVDGDEGRPVMTISASLNGQEVVTPIEMPYCSLAMELWPYVAVCGRVTAVRLLV